MAFTGCTGCHVLLKRVEVLEKRVFGSKNMDLFVGKTLKAVYESLPQEIYVEDENTLVWNDRYSNIVYERAHNSPETIFGSMLYEKEYEDTIVFTIEIFDINDNGFSVLWYVRPKKGKYGHTNYMSKVIYRIAQF